jgi:small ligand-binding sensory domain FIST
VRVGAGLSQLSSARDAAVEAARQAARSLGGREADLAFLFLSPDHLGRAAEAALALREELSPRRVAGCVAQGVLARRREVETGPALAVWAASLPGAGVEVAHAEGVDDLPELDGATCAVLLVDPFTYPLSQALETLNQRYPGLPLVGGIAAGAGRPGTQALVVDEELYEGGAALAAISGVPVRTVVSQGCAPFGREAVITRAEDNIVYELAAEPAFERLRREIAHLSLEERRLAAAGVLAGLVIDENKAEYGRGDFLMRGIIGADEASGALAVGERVRTGQTLRFHYRDARSADEDLRQALRREVGDAPVAGALLFTCNGRGTHMFGEPDHDARTAAELLRCEALAGFFCGGEIGPVGGRAFLHGFTATLAVFLEQG